MSTQTEHSEAPSTLPPPELNPLVNPLLAENMGRWAQVYFTSPPEKREHAVQELLRELGAEHSARAEATVALSSSVAPAEETAVNGQALALAAQLVPDEHFTVDLSRRLITLEDAGKEHLEALSEELGGVWTSVRTREEVVSRALAALILFKRDQQYVVAEGKVQIVDESTGRLMPDRSWERGLHQLIRAQQLSRG